MSGRPRVLFLGEAVTLAHVARTATLAEALLPDHEVCVALAEHAHRFVQARQGLTLLPLESIPSRQFTDALRRGAPVYDEATLERYVQADLHLMDTLRPDLVVGDFRLSMSVSARLRGIACVTVTNAYWSPWYRQAAPLPVLPWTRYVPLPLARAAFSLASRPAMAMHSVPLNRVRKRHGLPSLGLDLRRVYTDADYVAYADVSELLPTPQAPATHRHIGPILWSPPVPPPEWWNEPIEGPTAYVTMGSSGDASLLGSIVSALDSLGISALVASAGAAFVPPAGSRARVAPYLPGVAAAQRADMVVCNGGSLTTQQALAAGKPVLGLASNMDQFFNMRGVSAAGAGICLRADRARPPALAQAAAQLLQQSNSAVAAHRLSAILARYSAPQAFRQLVAGILGASPAPGGRHEKDPSQPDPGVHLAVHPGLPTGLGQQPPRP